MYLDKTQKLLDEEKVSHVMYLNFRKIFYTVSDKALLGNLIEVSLEKNSLTWIENKH